MQTAEIKFFEIELKLCSTLMIMNMEGDSMKVHHFQINRSQIMCSHFIMN